MRVVESPATASRAGKLAGLGLAILGAGLLLRGAWLFWPRTVDDAFIVFRYADQVAAGNGAVFNVGERVEGYSSPAWLAMLIAPVISGLDPIPIAKSIGLLASLAAVVLVWRSLRQAGAGPAGAGLAALTLGASVVFQMWATAGLETNLYALLVFAGLSSLACAAESAGRSVFPSSAWLAAAALTRPEGLAIWIFGGIWAAVGPRATRAVRAWEYALAGLAPAIHLSWRWSYYGELLPNTYHVKTGGGPEMWRQGWLGFWRFVQNPVHSLWIAAATLGALLAWRSGRRTRVAIFAGAIVLHWIYVISVGDDGLRVHRFHAPVLPLLASLAGLTFLPASAAIRGRRLATAFGAGALAAATVLSLPRTTDEAGVALADAARAYQEGNERLGRRLASDLPPGTLIAVAAAGAIPYFSRLPVIDMYGLTDAHIARTAFPVSAQGRLMKWDHDYVLSRTPRVIVINRGYFRAGDPDAARATVQPQIMAVSPMDRELFARVSADGRYRLVPIEFEDGAVFFVFERAAGG